MLPAPSIRRLKYTNTTSTSQTILLHTAPFEEGCVTRWHLQPPHSSTLRRRVIFAARSWNLLSGCMLPHARTLRFVLCDTVKHMHMHAHRTAAQQQSHRHRLLRVVELSGHYSTRSVSHFCRAHQQPSQSSSNQSPIQYTNICCPFASARRRRRPTLRACQNATQCTQCTHALQTRQRLERTGGVTF